MEGRTFLEPGTTIDTYRIIRVVGAGGFGITYEAEDTSLATTVALKEYFPEDFATRTRDSQVRPASDRHTQTFEWGRSGFLDEARTLARFKHRSVVRVLRIFEANATAYMVMEFEHGPSFEKWLRNLKRPPSQDELDHIVGPLLDALEVMHSNSFLHRDIAPDNIIIRPDTTPVLLDFGAARKTVAAKTHALTGMFKQGYSPQEQYSTDGKFQGPWSDFYALGATLYRAVTGLPPDEAPSRGLHDTLLPASDAAKGTYRPSFLNMIDACLRVKPVDRPQTVFQVRDILHGNATLQPLAAAPYATTRLTTRLLHEKELPRPAASPGSKRPILAFLLTLMVVAGAGAGGYSYYQKAEAERQARAENEAKRQAEESRELDAIRKEIAVAMSPEALDRIQLREPRLRPEIEARRRLLAEIARFQRLAMLQEQIARETSLEALDTISATEPELRAAADKRKQEIEDARRRDLALTVAPGSGQSFRDCSTCPEMLVVPAGRFTMGSPEGEAGRNSNETQLAVTVQAPFAVGKFETTFAEWDACQLEGGCKGRPSDEGWGRGSRPVINVSWNDAKEYVVWLSRKTDRTYRLLTEAEWEYVARAGTTTPFWWGNEINPSLANYDGNYGYGTSVRTGEFRRRTVPVDSFKPNPWGLYNVHGNVWEWTDECNPSSEKSACKRRVVRGGGWGGLPLVLRSAHRSYSEQFTSSNSLGLRVARDISLSLAPPPATRTPSRRD